LFKGELAMRGKVILASLLILTFGTVAQVGAGGENYTRTRDVIYGRKFGLSLTMDVFAPKKDANGAAVIWVVSGGWFSNPDAINPKTSAEFLKRGYTVFAVVHGSQPRFTVNEIVQDMNRAVRFIRSKAKEFKIDPDRIGVMGGSAGGHLSLMLGNAGKMGDANSRDPIDRLSSQVQAVACFFPPTDFLNWGKDGYAMTSKTIGDSFKPALDFHEFDKTRKLFVRIEDEGKTNEILKSISPITYVSSQSAPSLIIHGDADKLVPIQQSERIMEKFKAAGVPAKLIVKPGVAHGWPGLDKDLVTFADWFDTYLLKRAPTANEKPSAALDSLRPTVLRRTSVGAR
jgi:acetyl esterase/lipase